MIEDLEKEIEYFMNNTVDSDQTLYEALQFEQAIDVFNLRFAMEDDDKILKKVFI